MEFATGALGTLIPKLSQLLHSEYKLQKGARKNIEFLKKELEHTQAALRIVGEVPLDQLNELVKLWARDARELSYHMEDVIDTFLVRVEGPDPLSRRSSKKFIRKIKGMLTMGKRHQIGEQINDIKERTVELATRRDRCKVDTISPAATTLDPRITSLYMKATDLVGISEAKKELLMKLQQQRIVSIVGTGGLGKTTLAKAVWDEVKSQFNCTAFITVSLTPDMRKIVQDMLYELNREVYGDIHNRLLDEKQLVDIARQFLHDKRYLVIIDDIWKTEHWDRVIKLALPDYNSECKIITTTRKVNVANHIGCAYEMQALSPQSSRQLLHRRIFGIDDTKKCLDDELVELSDRVLKKCAGVPLAIITVASLLASKGGNKEEWDRVCNSIGTGMENSLDVENMRKILSYSYYDLPSHLRTCLLYLCMFPEDFIIGKDRLIWLWIAEEFIQHKKQWKKSLFEIGESYFYELMNRSMIQAVYSIDSSEISGCHVHDIVLDLLCYISSEENFITMFRDMDQISSSKMTRRLSLQNGKTDSATTQVTPSMQLVRSIVALPSALDKMPALQCFKVLRVLDLHGCNLSRDYSIQYLGSLFHLRYLNLNGTGINKLPETIGNLQVLQLLDIKNNKFAQLPECVYRLRNLLCLSVDWAIRVSNEIWNLTSLEEITTLCIEDELTDCTQSLGFLSELRVLSIMWLHNKTDMLVESLCKLRKIQWLEIYGPQFSKGELDAWAPPQHLRGFITERSTFSVLPVWMNSSTHFRVLTDLKFGILEVQQEHLDILGRLPALQNLYLVGDYMDQGIIGRQLVIGASLFPCLMNFEFRGSVCPLMFQQGAMPRLRYLGFDFQVPDARKISGSDGSFDLGLGNLLWLHEVIIIIGMNSDGAREEEVEKAKDVLRHAAEMHPNRPRVSFL